MSNIVVDQWRSEVYEKGKYIWELVYPVRIAASATLNEFEIKNFGRRSTGDRVRDEAALKEQVMVYITPDAMVEHYRIGTPFTFVNNQDAQHVYDVVASYLKVWAEQLTKAVNLGEAPIDDLLLMDRFASDLLTATVNINGARPAVSLRFFEKFSLGLNRGEGKDVAQEGKGQHNSMAEVFNKVLFGKVAGPAKQADPSVPNTAMSRWK